MRHTASVRETTACVPCPAARCERRALDYDNRVDCLQAKLRMAEIHSIRNQKLRKLHASKKYVRSVNGGGEGEGTSGAVK